MSAQIINFSLNRTSLTEMAFYNVFSDVETKQAQDDLAPVSNQNHQSFEEILLNKELAEEMFPPDYFLLVE